MTIQEQAAQLTRDSGEALFAAARAMPREKLNWKPMGEARTALHILQECAYYLPTLAPMLSPGEDFMAVAGPLMQESASWDTLEKVEAAYDRFLPDTLAFIRSVPDEALSREIPLPWEEGVTMPVWKMLLSLYWNNVYHQGQLNYIQLQYGDKEMHSGM
jgi:uncharacterized damage-inducible protein DinB